MKKSIIVFFAVAWLALPLLGQEELSDLTPPVQSKQAVGKGSRQSGANDFVSVAGRRFVDPEGRHLLLHGMSMISKSREENYQSWHGPKEFALMHAWGMNCIRLGILWDGLEPEPGKYDEEYLQQVDKRISWARENGLYVFLDMHQDLFSVKYSDGAPEWATLDEGLPHDTSGNVWSDAYYTSAAVQRAFDNFWANKPCPDGVGVQDRFALAWKHLAARYAEDPVVIGYDLFNEPNDGADNLGVQFLMISEMAKALGKENGEGPLSEMSLALKWMDAEGRAALMKRLCDMELYTRLMDAPESMLKTFERKKMLPMFQRVTDAIREVDLQHIVFLETGMLANMGVRSGVEPVLNPQGKRDPQQAYAPHGYDIVVDTSSNASPCNDRVELIFSRHHETSIRLNMPMLIGEWGAYGNSDTALAAAQFVNAQFEKHLCSDTYWDYGRNIQDRTYFKALRKPIPVCIAGELIAYKNEFKKHRFICQWKEDPRVTAPSRIYVPSLPDRVSERIGLTPVGNGFTTEPSGHDETGVYLVIPPTGKAIERQLEIIGKP